MIYFHRCLNYFVFVQRPPVVPCLKNGGIRFTIIGNEYYFEPSCSAAHHLQQRLKAKLGDVRSAVDDDFIQLAISRTVIFLSQLK
jgi:hypothetical protein